MALWSCACGGGAASNSNPSGGGATNAITYQNSSLSGDYVFSLVGRDPSAYPIVGIGRLTSDGKGAITNYWLNLSHNGSVSTLSGAGSYSIANDGQGTLTLDSLSYHLALTSSEQAQAIGAGSSDVTTLRIERQSSTSTTEPTGDYVYEMLDSSTYGQSSELGSLNFAAHGAFTLTGRDLSTGAGSWTRDASGLGSFTFGNVSRYFLQASNSRLLMVDDANSLVGWAEQRKDVYQPSGKFVYNVAGVVYADSQAGQWADYSYVTIEPLNEIGVFTSDGAGALSAAHGDYIVGGVNNALNSMTGQCSNVGQGLCRGSLGSRNFYLWMIDATHGALMLQVNMLAINGEEYAAVGLARVQGSAASALNGSQSLMMSGLRNSVNTHADLSDNYTYGQQTAMVGVYSQTLAGSATQNNRGAGSTLNNSGSLNFGADGRITGSIAGLPIIGYSDGAGSLWIISHSDDGDQWAVSNHLFGVLRQQE